jgi:hypothetical protein
MDWDKDWNGRPIYYDRQGKPMTLQQWAEKFEDAHYRHVARDVIGPDEPLDPAPLITVMTFWLGLNHDWRSDEPLIFETLVTAVGCCQLRGQRVGIDADARRRLAQVEIPCCAP